MRKTSPYRLYLAVGLLTALLGLGAVGGVNALVDPYLVFKDHHEIDGQPRRFDFGVFARRLSALKIWSQARGGEIFVVGSSVAKGMMATSLAPEGPVGVAAALPGTHARELARVLDFAASYATARKNLFVVEPYLFGARWTPGAGYRASALSGAPPLLSYAGLMTNFTTAKNTASLLSWRWGLRAAPPPKAAGGRGVADLAAGVDELRFLMTNDVFYEGGRPDVGSLAVFAAALRRFTASRQAGQRVYLLIPPLHPWQHALFLDLYGEDAYRAWKRSLLAAVEQAQTAGPGVEVALFDFSTYYAAARVAAGASGLSAFAGDFADLVHVFPRFGERLTAALAAGQIDDFAQQVTPASIETLLDEESALFAAWRAENPSETALIAETVAEVVARP
jgi:hypothetical protein